MEQPAPQLITPCADFLKPGVFGSCEDLLDLQDYSAVIGDDELFCAGNWKTEDVEEENDEAGEDHEATQSEGVQSFQIPLRLNPFTSTVHLNQVDGQFLPAYPKLPTPNQTAADALLQHNAAIAAAVAAVRRHAMMRHQPAGMMMPECDQQQMMPMLVPMQTPAPMLYSQPACFSTFPNFTTPFHASMFSGFSEGPFQSLAGSLSMLRDIKLRAQQQQHDYALNTGSTLFPEDVDSLSQPKTRKRKRCFEEPAVIHDLHGENPLPVLQCKGMNRKKKQRCRNAALMEFIGPQPHYCAEHIFLDPDALYHKCSYPMPAQAMAKVCAAACSFFFFIFSFLGNPRSFLNGGKFYQNRNARRLCSKTSSTAISI
jgi:hypothetical protein